MNLKEYFEIQGTGILSTANSNGEVNSAVYSRPHITGKDTLMFIMGNKRSRANIQENPKASFLFIEQGEGYNGVRLFLTKTREVQDDEAIATLSRKPTAVASDDKEEERRLVHFTVDKAIALLGDKEIELS